MSSSGRLVSGPRIVDAPIHSGLQTVLIVGVRDALPEPHIGRGTQAILQACDKDLILRAVLKSGIHLLCLFVHGLRHLHKLKRPESWRSNKKKNVPECGCKRRLPACCPAFFAVEEPNAWWISRLV